MRISIKHALIAGIIALMLVIVVASTLSTYISTERVLVQQAHKSMQNAANDRIARAIDFLKPIQQSSQLTATLAEQTREHANNVLKLERDFFLQLRLNPALTGVYLGQPDGSMLFVMRSAPDSPAAYRTKLIRHGTEQKRVDLYWRDEDFRLVAFEGDIEDHYDPRTRPWYRQAVVTKDQVLTEPYPFFTARQPGITRARPIYAQDDPEQLIGVIGVDLEITALSNFLQDLPLGEQGAGFIMTRQGKVIAHSQPEKIRPQVSENGMALIDIAALDDPLATRAYAELEIASSQQLPAAQARMVNLNFAGEPYHAAFVPFKDAGWPWVMGVYATDELYLSAFKANQLNNAIAVLIIGSIATLLAFLLARTLIRPINELGKQARNITSGHLGMNASIRTPFEEIQTTANAFRSMNDALLEEKRHNKTLNSRLRDTSLSTIYRLTAAAEFKDTDNDADTHLPRMAMLAVMLAEQMGMPQQFCDDLMIAAPMHDIGKLGIPDNVLFKEGPLDENEWAIMCTHTEIGGRILKDPETPILELGRQIAMTHHEHWDGHGYPAGLKGSQIPVSGRICAVADAFDALASERCYRDSMELDEAFNIIREGSGIQFDPSCVAALDVCEQQVRELYAA